MRKNRKKIIIILAIVFFVLLLVYIYLSYLVVLPVKSSANSLTLVKNGACLGPSKIILRHHINDIHICDYTLDLKIGLWHQTFQKYKLPKFDKGWIEVCVELENNNGYINARFENAKELYEKGLLIYFRGNNYSVDRYVYCKSGKNNLYFHKKEGVFDWGPTADTSGLKKIVKQEIGYSNFYYGWKEENKWVKTKP